MKKNIGGQINADWITNTVSSPPSSPFHIVFTFVLALVLCAGLCARMMWYAWLVFAVCHSRCPSHEPVGSFVPPSVRAPQWQDNGDRFWRG